MLKEFWNHGYCCFLLLDFLELFLLLVVSSSCFFSFLFAFLSFFLFSGFLCFLVFSVYDGSTSVLGFLFVVQVPFNFESYVLTWNSKPLEC